LESLVHVGWTSGISGLVGLGLGFGWGFSAYFEVDTPADVVASFVSAATLARLRS